jgi:hypothetical protein
VSVRYRLITHVKGRYQLVGTSIVDFLVLSRGWRERADDVVVARPESTAALLRGSRRSWRVAVRGQVLARWTL